MPGTRPSGTVYRFYGTCSVRGSGSEPCPAAPSAGAGRPTFPDPLTIAVDTLLCGWSLLGPYASPPTAVFHWVVIRLLSANGAFPAWVAPCWPRREWCPDRLRLSVAVPRRLPSAQPCVGHTPTVFFTVSSGFRGRVGPVEPFLPPQRFVLKSDVVRGGSSPFLACCHLRSTGRVFQGWCKGEGPATLPLSAHELAGFLIFHTSGDFSRLWPTCAVWLC